RERADERQRSLAHVPVLVGADGEPVADERERDAGGRELRQRDTEEDHPAEDVVDPDEGTDETDEHAADERIAEEKARAEYLEQLAHRPAATAPNTSAMCSGVRSSSAVPFTTRPSSTQMTERTTWRTMR